MQISEKIPPIRILCVFSTLDRGGAETMCMNLYRCINRENIQFDFVKHTPTKGEYEDEILSLGGKVYVAPRYQFYNHISYTKWWRNFLKSHPEYQIIHGHYFTISAVYFACCKKAGRTTIGHCHSTYFPIEIRKNPLRRIASERLIAMAEQFSDYCLACSQAAGKWMYKKKPFTVLPNAIYTEKFAFDKSTREYFREQFELSNKRVLGTVANFSSAKNPIGLIDIFKAVHQCDAQSKLLWIGEGPLRPEIEQKISNEGLTDSVILTGSRSDVPALLQAMDYFLLPSIYEGLPVVMVEAQAAGLPCFVSDTVTREAEITGLCQYLPLNNPNAWADAILNDHTPRENTSQKIIEAGYDILTTARWLEEFYLSVYEEHKER